MLNERHEDLMKIKYLQQEKHEISLTRLFTSGYYEELEHDGSYLRMMQGNITDQSSQFTEFENNSEIIRAEKKLDDLWGPNGVSLQRLLNSVISEDCKLILFLE